MAVAVAATTTATTTTTTTMEQYNKYNYNGTTNFIVKECCCRSKYDQSRRNCGNFLSISFYFFYFVLVDNVSTCVIITSGFTKILVNVVTNHYSLFISNWRDLFFYKNAFCLSLRWKGVAGQGAQGTNHLPCVPWPRSLAQVLAQVLAMFALRPLYGEWTCKVHW